MQISCNVWYKALDKYNDDDFYNYFISLDDIVKYYSISWKPSLGKSFQYIEESYDEFQENILDNYTFERTSRHVVLKSVFSNEETI